ncbi:uncharacterized protein EI90DRAFT_3055453 [Cantharellus anzutake]|uniref:uncharacterized protein n=1 Tax=Cantharellus anzutake TaxID=1750568 RepID=UPI0019036A53|nr:uncharacterized protein EI90DRAFT_3055453 [Cantharellus anzutake]KAF8332379.1 hypothetical protein EI90DRAFT_3055453 [Cantharellus anzutake]
MEDCTLARIEMNSATEIRPPSLGQSSFRSVVHQQRLRAAASLPTDWSKLPNVLVSQSASPMAKRLCLSILFASYIIRPDLSSSSHIDDSAQDGMKCALHGIIGTIR